MPTSSQARTMPVMITGEIACGTGSAAMARASALSWRGAALARSATMADTSATERLSVRAVLSLPFMVVLSEMPMAGVS